MASIARCLRIARPSVVSAFAQSSVRIARPFSVTANSEPPVPVSISRCASR
ncbi:hypothetical protein NEUTE2DRAFT_57281 [Neurospora tetrasperma FGSC 2509]|nr:hypothetical protein NEUTE2DRAFT_57281 [Neurospora tetrasperma FGSC 2509]